MDINEITFESDNDSPLALLLSKGFSPLPKEQDTYHGFSLKEEETQPLQKVEAQTEGLRFPTSSERGTSVINLCSKNDVMPPRPTEVYVESLKNEIKIEAQKLSSCAIERANKLENPLNITSFPNEGIECENKVAPEYPPSLHFVDASDERNYAPRNEKLYCHVCDSQLENEREFKDHMSKHFSCEFCKKVLRTGTGLTAHIKKAHPQECEYKPSSDDSESVSEENENEKKIKRQSIVSNARKRKINISKAATGKRRGRPPKSGRETCGVCKKTFAGVYELKRHMSMHARNDTLKCESCAKVFFAEADLAEHIKQFHNLTLDTKGFSKCIICSVAFSHEDALKKHREENPFSCDACNKHFSTNRTYIAHMNKHSSEKVYQCKHCDKSYLIADSLRSHKRDHHKEEITSDNESEPMSKSEKTSNLPKRPGRKKSGEKQPKDKIKPKCDICGKSFIGPYELKRHMNLHTKDKAFRCVYCTKLFFRDTSLASHIRKYHKQIEDNPRFLKCSVCCIAFLDEDTLRSHIEENPYSCNSCNKHYANSHSYKAHMNKHSSGKSYMCDVCHASFFMADDLRSHSRKCHRSGQSDSMQEIDQNKPRSTKPTCDEDGNVQCDVCNEMFGSGNELETHNLNSTQYGCKICRKHFKSFVSLKLHMNMHSKKTVYQCEYCTKPYLIMSSLRTHIRTQHPNQVQITDNRITSYFCHICDQKFPLYKDLVTHMHSHKGEKPFKCEQCDRQFSVGIHLEVHKKRRHNNVKPYNCDICHEPFFRKKYMMKHYVKVHMDGKTS